MDSSHFSQHLNLLQPDSKLIKSGIEYELGKYINDVRVEDNCIVKGTVKRYNLWNSESPSYIVFVEFEKDGQLFIDYIEVNSYVANHSFFGYDLEYTDEFRNISYNKELKEGTILAKTTSLGKDGDYKYGISANVAFISHPSVSVDGYVVSESFAKRSAFTSIMKRVINISDSMIPLNINGSKEQFKFIPDIGERVREDGLLCAIRKKSDQLLISDISDEALMKEDPLFDDLIYVNPQSEVIDIKVVRGNYNKKTNKLFSQKMTEQLDYYANEWYLYCNNILFTMNNILKEKEAIYGKEGNYVRLTPRLHRLLNDAYINAVVIPSGQKKVAYRKEIIEQYWIEVTTRSVLIPTHGYKMTDTHA